MYKWRGIITRIPVLDMYCILNNCGVLIYFKKKSHRWSIYVNWCSYLEEIKDIKRVIRIRKSKKHSQHNGQKGNHRLTKHTHKTTDRVTRTPLKSGGELRCSGKLSSSCSTSGTCSVNLVTYPVISHEWGQDRVTFTTSGTYAWSFVTQIFHSEQPCYVGDRKSYKVMTST